MKRAEISLFLMFLLVIPYVSAQSSRCQYIDNETYSANEVVLTYEDSNISSGKIPVFSDFVKGNKSSFMVFNPNDYEILINLNYTVEGHAGGNKGYAIKVPPNGYAPAKEYCYADGTAGECAILPDSIKYVILKPQIMYPKNLSVSKTRDICDKPCTANSECPGGSCNYAGYCGKVVLPCQNGKLNCLNISCVNASTKKAGEAYLCKGECESGVGEGGICKWNDGHVCTKEKEKDCFSGNCSIAGMCGPFKICPNGTQNCNWVLFYCRWHT